MLIIINIVALLKPWHMKGWSSVAILEYAVESVGEGLTDIATHKDASLSPSQWRALADMTWNKNVVGTQSFKQKRHFHEIKHDSGRF